MKQASVADLRNNFRKVAAWVEHGETVQILKRGRPFAQLVATPAQSGVKRKPDMLKQLREIWGDRCFSDEQVQEMRQVELEGEEG